MTRREDKREWIKLAVDLPVHPEFYGISTAAKWLYVTGLAHAGRHLTDGMLPVSRVVAEAEVNKSAVRELVGIGRWHEADHHCDRCEQPKAGWVVIHDYLLHNRSKNEAEDQRTKRASAGRKGAEKRWGQLRVVPPSA